MHIKKINLRASLCFLLVSTNCFADVKHSVGLGAQYSLLGYQAALDRGKNRFFGSIGLGTIHAGFQRFLDQDDKHSLGFGAGVSFLTVGVSEEIGYGNLSYNYFPAGRQSRGLVFSLDLLGLDNYSESFEWQVAGGIAFQF